MSEQCPFGCISYDPTGIIVKCSKIDEVEQLKAELAVYREHGRERDVRYQYAHHRTSECVKKLVKELATERKRREELEKEVMGLRKRIHHLEGHNQYFFRCENPWCHPYPEYNPALAYDLPDGGEG